LYGFFRLFKLKSPNYAVTVILYSKIISAFKSQVGSSFRLFKCKLLQSVKTPLFTLPLNRRIYADLQTYYAVLIVSFRIISEIFIIPISNRF